MGLSVFDKLVIFSKVSTYTDWQGKITQNFKNNSSQCLCGETSVMKSVLNKTVRRRDLRAATILTRSFSWGRFSVSNCKERLKSSNYTDKKLPRMKFFCKYIGIFSTSLERSNSHNLNKKLVHYRPFSIRFFL